MSRSTQAWELAVRSFGVDPSRRVRPSVWQWLRYALWLRLPERYDTWVLFDATTSTWVLRYFARILVVVVPPAVLIGIFLPATTDIRVLTAVVTGGSAFLLTALWVNEGTEYRLVQTGWPWDTGPTIRERRADAARLMGR